MKKLAVERIAEIRVAIKKENKIRENILITLSNELQKESQKLGNDNLYNSNITTDEDGKQLPKSFLSNLC